MFIITVKTICNQYLLFAHILKHISEPQNSMLTNLKIILYEDKILCVYYFFNLSQLVNVGRGKDGVSMQNISLQINAIGSGF